jgi:hypothetical protein
MISTVLVLVDKLVITLAIRIMLELLIFPVGLTTETWEQ